MPQNLLNSEGVSAALRGDAEHAERCWRLAIRLAPGEAQAWYNLGLLLAGQQRTTEAVDCYRQAILLKPGNAAAHNNLGLLLAANGRRIEAENCYRQALAGDPGYAAAYGNLAILLAQGKRHAEAESCYRQALKLAPDDAATHSNLGALLAGQRRFDEAERCYRKAIALTPNNAGAHSNLGILLANQRRHEEAEQCYRQALALAPNDARAYSNLGLLLEETGREAEAENCHRKALALDPGSAEIHANLADLLAHARRWIEAEAGYRLAIRLKPESPATHSNLGVMLANCRREAAAEKSFRRALALDPGYQLARLNLGFLLLRQGRFAEGWPLHEARYDRDLPDNGIAIPELAFPRWRGESLAGKSLLVWPEQGYGDEIQFCRYLPLLKAQGVTRLTLVCKKPLKALLGTLAGVDLLLGDDEAGELIAAHDYWTFPLSIPLHLRTRVDSIPASIPYLRALPERLAKWAPAIVRGRFNVGLLWAGNPGHHNDAYRSLPSLSLLAPLWSVPGVRFFSLQKGRGEEQQSGEPRGSQALVNLGAAFDDFADSAAVISQLDLVITVDSAVAHLAGALGKPCWLLLAHYRTDWRWLEGRSDSPWYPGMRLFRQPPDEHWSGVIAELASALRKETKRNI